MNKDYNLHLSMNRNFFYLIFITVTESNIDQMILLNCGPIT